MNHRLIIGAIDRTALARASWALALQTALKLRKKGVLSDADFDEVMAEATMMFDHATDSADSEAREFLMVQAQAIGR